MFVPAYVHGENFDYTGAEVCGMPIIEVDHMIGNQEIAIGTAYSMMSYIPMKFADAWEASEEP